jgi:hypothetical protein
MPAVNDDLELSTALADLTSDQPSAPPDRFTAIRRKAASHRRRQVITGIAVVAATAAVVGLVRLPAFRTAVPAGRSVPGWALPWPDIRNGSVPQSVLDRAVIAWRDEGNGSAATEPPPGSSAREVARLAGQSHVIWYAGQTAVGGQVVFVIFEATGPSGPTLAVGSADAADVMNDQPAWSDAESPWVFTSVPAPKPSRPGLVIGLNVHGAASASGQNPDDWIVLLTDPAVSRISWRETGRSGVLRPDHGLVVKDMGQLRTAVRLTQVYAGANLLRRAVDVGVPGAGTDEPQLELAAPLSPPAGFEPISSGTAQGDETDSIGAGPPPSGRHYVLLARCFGPAPLQIAAGGHHVGTAHCSAGQFQATIPAAWITPGSATLSVQTSGLTSWRYGLGTEG